MTIEGSDLLKEYPVIFLPSLAVKIGLNKAIIVQKLHFFLSLPDSGKVIDGHRWIFNTMKQWREAFPFWCIRTIQTALRKLEKRHIVESCQPDGRMSRKKYYRLNQGMLVKFMRGSVSIPDAANLADSTKQDLPIPKHGIKHGNLTKESKETPSVEGEQSLASLPLYSPTWKPITGTKEEQLARRKPPKEFPSEQEVSDFMEEEELNELLCGKADDVYETLCNNKWSHWNGRKWIQIRDWRAYIRAFDEKIRDATGGGLYFRREAN